MVSISITNECESNVRGADRCNGICKGEHYYLDTNSFSLRKTIVKSYLTSSTRQQMTNHIRHCKIGRIM